MKDAAGKPWEIIRGDALKLISAFAPNTFDALITDPPYASGGIRRLLRSDPVFQLRLRRLRGRRRSHCRCEQPFRLYFFHHPCHRDYIARIRHSAGRSLPQEPRPVATRQWDADRRGRDRDYLCQGNPDPHHRLMISALHQGGWRTLPGFSIDWRCAYWDQETGLLTT